MQLTHMLFPVIFMLQYHVIHFVRVTQYRYYSYAFGSFCNKY
jgi:hypothetical protein